jgi:topoisomerase IA-like protein
VTSDCAERLVRLPLWIGIEDRQDEVIEAIAGFYAD